MFDAALLAGETATAPSAPSLARRGFLLECLLELPATLRRGDPVEELVAFAARHGADGVVTTAAVDPRFREQLQRLQRHLPVHLLAPEPFLPPAVEPFTAKQLGRFSRYWRRAEPAVWGCWPAAPSADRPPSSWRSCSSTAFGSLSRSGSSSCGKRSGFTSSGRRGGSTHTKLLRGARLAQRSSSCCRSARCTSRRATAAKNSARVARPELKEPCRCR